MTPTTKSLRSRVAMLATVGVTGALLVGAPLAANASQTVIDFQASTSASDYPYLTAIGGSEGVNWAPWPDNDNPNAAPISGATNWYGRAGWSAHNFVVQDDGSSTNNALWIQKAEGACPGSGIGLNLLSNGGSFISASNKVVTIKLKAWDANVPVSMTLTDIYGGHGITATATAATSGSFNTLSFNFASPSDGSYVNNFSYAHMQIVADTANAIAGTGHDGWGGSVSCTANGATASKAYLIDDITYTAITTANLASGPDVAHKLTFDEADTLGTSIATNPQGAFLTGMGIGTPPVAHSGTALEINKGDGHVDWSTDLQAWGGINMFAPTGEVFTSPTYKTISFDYYSPESGHSPLMIKLIAEDTSEVWAGFDTAPGWGTYSVDVSTITTSGHTWDSTKLYKTIVFHPGFAEPVVMPSGLSNVTPSGQKFYIDNLVVNGYRLATKTGTLTLTGTAKVGKTLTVGGLTWAGNTVQVSYKWYRCSVKKTTGRSTAPVSADKCSVISGKTASTYKLVRADRGKYIRAAIIGTTTAGSVYALTKTTSAKVG